MHILDIDKRACERDAVLRLLCKQYDSSNMPFGIAVIQAKCATWSILE